MEMTFKQYCDNYLETNIYGAKYKVLGLDSREWESCKFRLLAEWKEKVLKHAEHSPLQTKVITSWIGLCGESTLFRTFRGRYERGIANYKIPKQFQSQ